MVWSRRDPEGQRLVKKKAAHRGKEYQGFTKLPEGWTIPLANGQALRQQWETEEREPLQGLPPCQDTTDKMRKAPTAIVVSLTPDSKSRRERLTGGARPLAGLGCDRKDQLLWRREDPGFTSHQHHVQWERSSSPRKKSQGAARGGE